MDFNNLGYDDDDDDDFGYGGDYGDDFGDNGSEDNGSEGGEIDYGGESGDDYGDFITQEVDLQPSYEQTQHTSIISKDYERGDPRIKMVPILSTLFDNEDILKDVIKKIDVEVEKLNNFMFLNPEYLSYAYLYKFNFTKGVKKFVKWMNDKKSIELKCPSFIRYLNIIENKK